MMPRVLTCILVSRGLEGLLAFSLEHLETALLVGGAADGSRVVIVDNASPTPYRAAVWSNAGRCLIRLDRHHSFSAANNLAAHRHPNPYLLLLNNDVLLHPETLGGMLDLMERNPRIGICGARLIFPDGSLQHGGVVFGPGRRGPYHVDRRRPADRVPAYDREYQAVTGACLLARHSLWSDLGGLDEDYSFGLEDVDLCLRARRLGWRVWCYHGTESLHFESMTPGRVRLDVGSRRLFMTRWKGRYSIDG
jgi:GT2 family glycosyltransferase